MQLLALYCLDHLMLWDFLTLIATAIVYRHSKLDDLPYAGQIERMVQGGKHQQTPHCEYKLYGTKHADAASFAALAYYSVPHIVGLGSTLC